MVGDESNNDSVFIGYFSIPKILAAETFALLLIIFMSFPGDTSRIVHTAFVFAPEFIWIRIFSIVTMSLAFGINLPNVYRAIASEPALFIGQGRIRMRGLFDKSVYLKEVESIKSAYQGAIYLNLKSGDRMGIPLILFKNYKAIKQKITESIS